MKVLKILLTSLLCVLLITSLFSATATEKKSLKSSTPSVNYNKESDKKYSDDDLNDDNLDDEDLDDENLDDEDPDDEDLDDENLDDEDLDDENLDNEDLDDEDPDDEKLDDEDLDDEDPDDENLDDEDLDDENLDDENLDDENLDDENLDDEDLDDDPDDENLDDEDLDDEDPDDEDLDDENLDDEDLDDEDLDDEDLDDEDLDDEESNYDFGEPDITGTIGECNWEYYRDEEILKITGNGSMGTQNYSPWKENYFNMVVIEHGVTSINPRAFYGNEDIEEVFIPESVTSIGKEAFRGCTNLLCIELPDSLSFIPEGAFRGCEELYDITISDDVISIGAHAFEDCINIDVFFLPQKLETIGSYAFSGCSALTELEFTENIVTIGEYAFDNCESLETLSFPKSINSIGNKAFYQCDGLSYVEYAGTNHEWEKLKIASNAFNSNTKIVFNGRVALAECRISQPSSRTYNGKSHKPSVTVTDGSVKLIKGTDYTIEYRNNKKAGNAKAIIKGKGCYTGFVTKIFKIKKAPNPLKAVVRKLTAKSLKSKTITFKNAIKIKLGKGKISYKIIKGSRFFTVNKNGVISAKKNIKKGKYSIVINVTANAGKNYIKTVKPFKVKITIK